MYVQLVVPNLNITERAGLCLQFTRRAFGAPLVEATAWQGWQNARFKHSNRNFPGGVSVPVWFDWWGDLGNGQGRRRYGHVAFRHTDGKVYSSPPTGFGRAWFATIDDLIRAFGGDMTFVGWSEDISGVRVIQEKGEDMISKEQYLVGARAVGTEYGKDFDYNPNITVDEFVRFLDGQAPRITSWMERELADKITGTKDVIGNDYNSPFLGQRVVTHYPEMVKFWVEQARAADASTLKRAAVIDYVGKNLK